MAYTNPWDVTVPLDTQAANQGAADFRNLKLDIIQRFGSTGFGSAGILANRPTPDSNGVSTNWEGVMYWSTDTRQVFQWHANAWVDITANIPISAPSVVKYSNLVPVTLTDNGTAQDGVVLSLPANALVVGSVLRIKARVFMPAGSTTPFSKISLYFGGVYVAMFRGDAQSAGALGFDSAIDFEAVLIVTAVAVEFGYGNSSMIAINYAFGSGANAIYVLASQVAANVTGIITIKTHIEAGGINTGNTVRTEFIVAEVT